MKIIRLFCISLLWAQHFETGFFVGPQLLSLLKDDGDYDLRLRGIGFVGGVSENFWFAQRWGLSLEAQYVWGRFRSGSSFSVEITRFITGLRTPLLLRYQVPLSERVSLELGAGVYAGFILAAEEDVKYSSFYYGRDTSYTRDLFDKSVPGADIHRRLNFGGAFMGGVRTQRFGFALWHDWMLSKANDPKCRCASFRYNATAVRISYFIGHS